MSAVARSFMGASQPKFFDGIRFRVGVTGARIALRHFTVPGARNSNNKNYIPHIYTTVDAFNSAVVGFAAEACKLTSEITLVQRAYGACPDWITKVVLLLSKEPVQSEVEVIRAELRKRGASQQEMRKALIDVFHQESQSLKKEFQLFDNDHYVPMTIGGKRADYYRLSPNGVEALAAAGYLAGNIMLEIDMQGVVKPPRKPVADKAQTDEQRKIAEEQYAVQLKLFAQQKQYAQSLYLRGYSPLARAFNAWLKPFDLLEMADMEPDQTHGSPIILSSDPGKPFPDWTFNPSPAVRLVQRALRMVQPVPSRF